MQTRAEQLNPVFQKFYDAKQQKLNLSNIEAINAFTKELSISQLNLNAEVDIKALIEFMQARVYIKKVDLSEHDLSKQFNRLVSGVINSELELTELSVAFCHLESDTNSKALVVFLEAYKTSLVGIDIGMNKINEEHMSKIIEIFNQNKNIAEFNFAGNSWVGNMEMEKIEKKLAIRMQEKLEKEKKEQEIEQKINQQAQSQFKQEYRAYKQEQLMEKPDPLILGVRIFQSNNDQGQKQTEKELQNIQQKDKPSESTKKTPKSEVVNWSSLFSNTMGELQQGINYFKKQIKK